MEDFYLYVTYKGKTTKFKVLNPTDTLNTLIEKLRRLNKFEMPSVDPSGAPINYYFGKVDEKGETTTLHPKIGKTEMHLHDYNVKNGDRLTLVYEPIAG